MQWVTSRGCNVRMFLAVIAAVAGTTVAAPIGNSTQGALLTPAHLCPPIC